MEKSMKHHRKHRGNFQGTKINPTRYHPSQIKIFLILIPLAIFMALPIIYIISTAFKPLDELFAFPPRFFVKNPTIDNFRSIFTAMSAMGIPFSRYLMNSILSTLLVVVFTVILTLCAAYVLSKKQFRMKKLLFTINTVSLMFVPAAVTIPRYLIVAKSGLMDTFAMLILPMLAMPVGLFLVKQFVDQIPDALIESARIDGAGDITIVFKIVAPMAAPSLATTAILAFQAGWNSVEGSTIFISNDSMKNLAFYLSSFTNANNTVAGMGISVAASLIMFLPNLIIFIIMQGKMLNTLAHSGIK